MCCSLVNLINFLITLHLLTGIFIMITFESTDSQGKECSRFRITGGTEGEKTL